MPIERIGKRIHDELELSRQARQLKKLGVVIWKPDERPEYSPEEPFIVAYERVVSDPSEFGGIFHKGETIIQLHFLAHKPQDMIWVFRDLMEKIPRHKEAGYAGFYGDTCVTPLIEHAKRMTGVEVIDPPAEAARQTSATYHQCVKREGYPAEYDRKPVRRVVMRINAIK